MREAAYYRKEENCLICELCPHACRLGEGQSGICRGRQNLNGIMLAVNYAQTVSLALDPIEKKPLYHFHPGSQIISLGPNSCNLSCAFCQNWQISQLKASTQEISIAELANLCRDHNPKQVAFTYSEPLMWFEYIYDFAKAASDVEIVLVTNGYLNPRPWKDILPYVKAMNIDLKSIRDNFYKQYCGAGVEVVKNNIRTAFDAGIHLEITNLLIPGLNDADEDLAALAGFVASIDQNIALHISAYRPCYKMKIRATTAAEVEHACEIASAKLNRVYAGNIRSAHYGRKN